VLRHLGDIYVPQDERTLRRIQQGAERLHRRVREWADSVVDLLPRGLSLHEDEVYILSLFLAQQRRLNMEIDALRPTEDLRTRLGRFVPFLAVEEDPDIIRTIHRTVAAHVDSDIDRACGFFCRDLNVPAESDPGIDWRVSIRFMAQSLHNLMSREDLKNYRKSPRRFELAVLSRDLAAAIVDRRRALIAAFSPEPVI
jgi:hypothetical protein